MKQAIRCRAGAGGQGRSRGDGKPAGPDRPLEKGDGGININARSVGVWGSAPIQKKRVLRRTSEDSPEERQLPTLPPGLAVPSAMTGLASLFGMGRGGSPSL